MSCKMCSTSVGTLAVPLAVLLGLVGWQMFSSRTAPKPPAFDSSITLTAAVEQSQADGKPVLALATADWCGPCQHLKRGALTDSEVVAKIKSTTTPVYVDVTDSNDPAAREAGRMLRVEGIPALILVRDGEEVSRLVGSRSSAEIIAWLDEFAS